MGGGVLYRLKSYNDASRRNITFGGLGDAFLSMKLGQYELLAKRDGASSAPADVVSYLLGQPADTSGLVRHLAFLKLGRDFKKKDPDPKKIPDFWTAQPLPLITEACRNMVEEVDPDIHQYFPVSLTTDPGGERIAETTFFLFICGRLIDIPMNDQASDPSTHDTQTIETFYLCRWRTIQERPDIQAYLEKMPIWRFRDRGRSDFYINKRFLDAAHQQCLKGFEETSNGIPRDIQHVWY